MNHQPAKKSFFDFGGSAKKRALVLVLGLLVFLGLLWVVFAILSSSKNASTTGLVDLTQQQNEIARVAGLGAQSTAASPDTRGLAETISLSISSSQQQLLSVLKKQHVKMNTKKLALKASKSTDDTLKRAGESNTYDSVFKTTIGQSLSSYQQALKAAYNKSASGPDKRLLNNMFDQAALLQTKLK